MHTFTQTLSSDEQSRLMDHIQRASYDLREVPYTTIAAKKPGLSLALYESGKLVAQGKQLDEWIEFCLEPDILLRTGVAEVNPASGPESETRTAPHIGIDESGKGDFFGPMVIAAYHLTPDQLPWLSRLGVRDSKQIKSDTKISEIAELLLARNPAHCELMILKPESYNPLVKKMGSVNRLLAWAHATVLEKLLDRFPDTPRAVADQFGPEHQITRALKTRGKQIELEQRHKAESDPAVAAASILARHRFVTELKQLGELAGTPLPRGATHVRPAGEELVKRVGPDILNRVAKTHFRTTRQVLEACGFDPALLGTPEPKPNAFYKRK
ncbi:MAG: ribonuclease HIII [Kiritimatiellia bacterium]